MYSFYSVQVNVQVIIIYTVSEVDAQT